ncbi:MAG: hypothetical protein HXM94_00115 [Parvimonas micra]|uniref:Uncharacterized protein n=1 Tax=Parvimonas micra TaxID=33033 RepID=A0A930DZ78_9FIRM|nr:hypothetical protein [Parvimonas micra]MBF1306193.1 hypothetical protein [Parvimonas micra]
MIKAEESKTFTFSDLRLDATLILKEIIDLTLEKEYSFQLKKDQNLKVVNFFLDLKNLEIVLDANRFNVSPWVNPTFNDSGIFKIGLIDYDLFSFKLDQTESFLNLSINKASMKSFLLMKMIDESSNLIVNFISQLKRINNKTDGSAKSYYFKVEDLIFTEYIVLEFNKLLKKDSYNPILNYFFKGLYNFGFSNNKNLFPCSDFSNLLCYSSLYLNKSQFNEFQKMTIKHFKTFDQSDGEIISRIFEHLIEGLGDLNSITSIEEVVDLLEIEKLDAAILNPLYQDFTKDDIKSISNMIKLGKVEFDNSKSFEFNCIHHVFAFGFLDLKNTMKLEVELLISLLNSIKQKNKVKIFFPRDLDEDVDFLIFEEIQPLLDCKYADSEIIYFDSF